MAKILRGCSVSSGMKSLAIRVASFIEMCFILAEVDGSIVKNCHVTRTNGGVAKVVRVLARVGDDDVFAVADHAEGGVVLMVHLTLNDVTGRLEHVHHFAGLVVFELVGLTPCVTNGKPPSLGKNLLEVVLELHGKRMA